MIPLLKTWLNNVKILNTNIVWSLKKINTTLGNLNYYESLKYDYRNISVYFLIILEKNILNYL